VLLWPDAYKSAGRRPLSLAERKRQLVRDQLGEAALRLLASQGYEETTVEQIVAAAGVSRRTFFRYFKSKEDVIVGSVGDLSATIRAELAARPEQENPQSAIRAALAVAVEQLASEPEKSVPIIRLLFDTPALHPPVPGAPVRAAGGVGR